MTLSQQIRSLEENIHKRRSKISSDIVQVKKEARLEFAAKATDPKVLIAALAAGFATDQLSRGSLPIISFLKTLQVALSK